jgi:hypothetical protein
MLCLLTKTILVYMRAPLAAPRDALTVSVITVASVNVKYHSSYLKGTHTNIISPVHYDLSLTAGKMAHRKSLSEDRLRNPKTRRGSY